MPAPVVYLIPTVLDEDAVALQTIPPYVLDAVKDCSVFFVEHEKTARRFLKKLWKEMVIDDYQWYTIHKAEDAVQQAFIGHLKAGRRIGILSEAGCPCIADPGQLLVETAHRYKAIVKPLAGPSSILLALMASGLNGQCFQFLGYLPIDSGERKKTLRETEADSLKRRCTQLFIETPYRNNALLKDILQVCQDQTRLCIAVSLTGEQESIETKTIKEWKKAVPDLNKRPAIFLLAAV